MIKSLYYSKATWWFLASVLSIFWLASNLTRSAPAPRNDLRSYVMGARAVSRGESPYDGNYGYYYPPLLAVIASPAAFADDDEIALTGRVILALSSIVLLLASASLTGLGGTPWGLALSATLFLPLFQEGLAFGNISVVVAAILAVVGLILRRFPLGAGALLALATHLKVVPVLFILFLLLSGIVRKDRTALKAAVSATVLSAALLALPWTGEYVSLVLSGGMQDAKIACGSNFSWVAYFAAVGIPLPSVVPVALALGAVWLLVRGKTEINTIDWSILHCLVVFASPIVWFHTFALAVLPATMVAAGVIRGRRISGLKSLALLDRLLALAAFAIVMDSEYYYMRSWIGRFVTPLLPLLLPVFLVWALIRQGPDGRPVS
ncbi:MAG: DUF2029 domain-containing protein [Deltaproteobacteria bacterium]|nr:DUF2029 domain-containing protein [Deltaproteobacteria bacterium]